MFPRKTIIDTKTINKNTVDVHNAEIASLENKKEILKEEIAGLEKLATETSKGLKRENKRLGVLQNKQIKLKPEIIERIRIVKEPIEKIKEVEVIKKVPFEVIKEVKVEVPVDRVVEKIVYKPVIVEKPVEIVKEVIKEVIKEVVKEVSIDDKNVLERERILAEGEKRLHDLLEGVKGKEEDLEMREAFLRVEKRRLKLNSLNE